MTIWEGGGGEAARGIGQDLTCIVLIDALGLVVCSCSDGLVYVLETRIGSVTLAAKARKLENRNNRSIAALSSAGHKPQQLLQRRTLLPPPERLNKLLVFSGHRKGVKCAVWCSASKSMASAGVDRQVVIWEPKTGDVLARLHGHKKTITNLQYRFHGQRDILISLDRRSDLKVWDPTNFVKLMQIGGVDGDLSVGSMAVLDDYILMFDRRPQIWKLKKAEQAGELSLLAHKLPLLQVCVDAFEFAQALCLDASGLLTVWELPAGRQSFNIYAEPPLSGKNDTLQQEALQRPTAADLDNSKRRLLVGFSRGACRVYNYSNGTVIHDLASDATAEIRVISMPPASQLREEEIFVKRLLYIVTLSYKYSRALTFENCIAQTAHLGLWLELCDVRLVW